MGQISVKIYASPGSLLSANQQQVLAANLSVVSATGQESDIIIGQDILEKITMDVNFSKHEMHVVPESDVADYTSNFHKLNIDSDKYGRLVTKIQIDGAPPTSAIVDMGNSSPIMMADSFRKMYHLDSGLPTSTGLIGTISGISKTICYSTRRIKIGDLTIADVPTDALTDWSAPQPINLGLPIFQQFDFILDLPNHAVWLRQVHEPHFEREMSGLLFSHRGSYLEIVHIASNSPADDGRFHIGDKIYSINRINIDRDYFRTDSWKWRYGPSGRSVELNVSGKIINLSLKRYS